MGRKQSIEEAVTVAKQCGYCQAETTHTRKHCSDCGMYFCNSVCRLGHKCYTTKSGYRVVNNHFTVMRKHRFFFPDKGQLTLFDNPEHNDNPNHISVHVPTTRRFRL